MKKDRWKRPIACFLVLALMAVLCLGCGGDKADGKVTIVIGEMTDLTGPASPAIIPFHYGLQDIIKYYNEEGFIPGVQLKAVTYDTHLNPARAIPGWEWCIERGAEVVQVMLATDAETLKTLAEREKVAIFTVSSTEYLEDPPGWVFGSSCLDTDQLRTMLNWISEEHWDYTAEGSVPKVGYCGWRDPMGIEQERALREYCQAHPDKFQWVDGFLAPVGTMSFRPEIEGLKDCDYVCPFGTAGAAFMKGFRAKGYDATFFSDASAPAFRGFYADMVGWEGLDGSVCVFMNRLWNETDPYIDLASEILYRYRADEAEEIINASSSYAGAIIINVMFLELLQEAIEEAGGAENFDGQAFYDAAIKFEVELEGFPKRFYTDTKRFLTDHVAVYEWSAEVEDLVRVSDWLPLITE